MNKEMSNTKFINGGSDMKMNDEKSRIELVMKHPEEILTLEPTPSLALQYLAYSVVSREVDFHVYDEREAQCNGAKDSYLRGLETDTASSKELLESIKDKFNLSDQ